MNADAFRHVYNYHFAENLALWDKHILTLPDALFDQAIDYSLGSVRNQIVHLMQVDAVWFAQLRGLTSLELPEAADYENRAAIRTHWDSIIADMQGYLNDLRDDMLFTKPFAEGEDKDLILWQVLLHVINHGTDHRAQLLRILHDFGQATIDQDYIFYAYDHP